MNINAVAAQVVADSTNPDPSVMAEEVVARLDPAEYRETLVYLCRGVVRGVISSQRHQTNGGQPARSQKVETIRENWRRQLDTPEFVPSAGAWIFLRDATHDQVLEMAGARRAKARELDTAADRYHRLALSMSEHGVARVGDLPDPTLAVVLKAAA